MLCIKIKRIQSRSNGGGENKAAQRARRRTCREREGEGEARPRQLLKFENLSKVSNFSNLKFWYLL